MMMSAPSSPNPPMSNTVISRTTNLDVRGWGLKPILICSISKGGIPRSRGNFPLI